MQSFIVRCTLVFLSIVLQFSALDVVFPHTTPNLLLALVLSWTLTKGFVWAWPWVVALGIGADILSLSTVGGTALALVCVSYAVSFLSVRFLTEHQGFGAVVVIGFVFLGTALYQGVLMFLVYISADMSSWQAVRGAMLGAWGSMWPVAIGNSILFFLIASAVRKLEAFLDFYDHKVVVGR